MSFFLTSVVRKIALAISPCALSFALIPPISAQDLASKEGGNTSRPASEKPGEGKCRPSVIPLENEAPPKIIIDPPLPAPLARGVAIIEYCAENVHIVPVFGANALQVTPRVGQLHVRVDDASWVWAEASGNPIILMGLTPGPHKVTIELENANHQTLDKGVVTFVIPKQAATGIAPEKQAAREATKPVTTSDHHPK